MKKIYEYSHLGGSEILKVRFPQIEEEIDTIIEQIAAEKKKVSKEKTMKDRILYSPVELNKQFKERFTRKEFTEIKESYTLVIESSTYTRIIPNVYKQIDFSKDGVLIEVQFGKYAFMFYDMAKFQFFFNESRAEVGVEIVPCHALHKEMSTGVSYGEQLIFDIKRLSRHFPAVPVKIILIGV